MPPRNLLVIMSDEHLARAMGCAGHQFVRTPNLDALAARGTRFARAYTPSPICVPARASFATGRYVHQTRMWDNALPYDGSIPGWGHALQAAGIPVESIGKLHYRAEEDPAGFDVEHMPMMIGGGTGMVWLSIRREADRVISKARLLGENIGPGDSDYTNYDRAVTTRARQWFADRARTPGDAPWCLFVGLVAAHFPLIVPRAFFDLYPLGSLPEPKLHPRAGYVRHPWVEKQNAVLDSESLFRSSDERLAAFSAYYGLCSWLDFNVGQILAGLEDSGFADDTTVIYTSDHGDNAGNRGLWNKCNMYEESAAIPLIVAGAGYPVRVSQTPVSLIDVSATIADHFGLALDTPAPATPLRALANAPDDPERVVFSEYHAAGAVSAAFMVRSGRWKYIHYVGFEPELFDLGTDPEETTDLSGNPDFADVRFRMEQALRRICDPEAVNAQAFADQDALIARYGGIAGASTTGAADAEPIPDYR